MKLRLGSKKGVSLVEEVCAVAVLVIAVVALAGGIGMSHSSVSRANTQDAAAAQAQDLADTLITVLSARTGEVSGDVLGDKTVQYAAGGAFSASGAQKQYAYQYTEESDQRPAGYKITVRVYYGAGRYVQMNAYAADTEGAFANASA